MVITLANLRSYLVAELLFPDDCAIGMVSLAGRGSRDLQRMTSTRITPLSYTHVDSPEVLDYQPRISLKAG